MRIGPCIALLAFALPATAQEPIEYACSSSFSTVLKLSGDEDDVFTLTRHNDVETYKLELVSATEELWQAIFKNLSTSESSEYLCIKRANYPNLREPPVTYSCTSTTTQLFFNSTNHTFIQVDLFSASSMPDMFPTTRGECHEMSASP
jgi:hypothetical protein